MNKASTDESRSRHFARRAKEYNDAAEILYAAAKSRTTPSQIQNPLDLLCAHSVELCLKAKLILDGKNDTELKSFGHNLSHIYKSLATEVTTKTFISDAEDYVARKWSALLQRERDRREAQLRAMGLETEDEMQEFGWLSNQEIEAGHPRLKKQIQWFSNRHIIDGSLFRYSTQSYIDERIVIDVFAMNEDAAVRSALWAVEHWTALLMPRVGSRSR